MCFDNDDCDWYAAIIEDETLPATKQARCGECGRIILVGEPVRHIFQQQREVCRHDPESDDYDGEETDLMGCPPDCVHDFGETFHHDICQPCDQLVEAIHQHEIEEGCGESESRPSLSELYEAMDRHRGPKYLAKAEALYPGITERLPAKFLCFRDDD